MNDIQLQGLIQQAHTTNNLLAEIRDQNERLINAINNLQFRTGNKPQHFDIVISECNPDTFRVVFNMRYVKDNPEQKQKNIELKNHIQKTITAGLGENKHYTIDKVEKSNADKTKSWQEWQFLFKSAYATAIGQRMVDMVESEKITVKGLDDLEKIASGVEQLELAAKPTATNQDNLLQQIHILGNEWATLCNPERGEWKTRHGAITKQYFGKDSTTELNPEQKEGYIRMLLRMMIREMGTLIHGDRFLGDYESEIIAKLFDGATQYQDLTTSQLRSMKSKFENQLSAQQRKF